MDLTQAVDAYISARGANDEAKAKATEAAKAFRRAEHQLVEAMLESNTPSMKRTVNGSDVNLIMQQRFRFSAREDNTAAIRAWLVDEAGDDEQFVRETINTQRLREWLREYVAEKGELSVPEHMKLDTSPGITARGWKGAK